MARRRARLLGLVIGLCAGCTLRWGPNDGIPVQGPATLPDLGSLRSCGSESPTALASCVDRTRLARDLVTIAHPRAAGSEHAVAMRALCAERLGAAGFEVEQQAYGTGVNVVGTKRGGGPGAEQLLVSAHYDGPPGCAGADDNGSGLAALLETARVLGLGRFERTLVAACWDEHESGLAGAAAYVGRAVSRRERFATTLVLDSVGFTDARPGAQQVPPGIARAFPGALAELDASGRRADFVTVLADSDARPLVEALRSHASRVGLRSIVLELGDAEKAASDPAHRSDQEPFWLDGYSAVLLTDSGDYRNAAHGCRGGDDLPDTLDYDFLEQVTGASVGALAALLGMREG
ncbi:MAG: M28 family peptidase [Myxococcales bacterium]|nr:M28 family peptidase [Myxococcales bacterium]